MAEGSGNYLTMQMLIFNIGLDIYSFFVLLMISQYLQKNRGDGQEQILFRQVIRYTALALIGDLGSWIVNGRAGVMMHFLGYAFNMVYMKSIYYFTDSAEEQKIVEALGLKHISDYSAYHGIL